VVTASARPRHRDQHAVDADLAALQRVDPAAEEVATGEVTEGIAHAARMHLPPLRPFQPVTASPSAPRNRLSRSGVTGALMLLG
jgi:hypothetical protein